MTKDNASTWYPYEIVRCRNSFTRLVASGWLELYFEYFLLLRTFALIVYAHPRWPWLLNRGFINSIVNSTVLTIISER